MLWNEYEALKQKYLASFYNAHVLKLYHLYSFISMYAGWNWFRNIEAKSFSFAGQGTLAPTRIPSLRTELLQFLLEHSDALNSQAVLTLSSGGAYLNLYHLLQLDTEATLDVLRCAFVEDEIPKPDFSSHDSADENMEPKIENDNGCQNILVQDTVNSLVRILNRDISQTERSDSEDVIGLVEEWPSKKDIGHMFEFIAYYVAFERANVSKSVLSQILEYLTSQNNFPPSVSTHHITSKRREKQVLALLEVVPETDWNASYVLGLCEKVQFYQVYLHIFLMMFSLKAYCHNLEILCFWYL